MYLSSKRLFQRFPYPLPADVVCMRLSSMNIPSICTIFPRFALIFQCIMQHHCTVLSVQNRFFLAMLRQYGLLSRHFSERHNPHSHIAPSLLNTLQTVCHNIFTSNLRLHSLIYCVSSFTTSSKSVILLLPLTCHIPVMPGLVARRARW